MPAIASHLADGSSFAAAVGSRYWVYMVTVECTAIRVVAVVCSYDSFI